MCEKSGYKSQREAKWAKKSTSFTLNLSPNFCQLYAPSFGIISTRGETSKILFLVKKSSVLIRFSDNFYAEMAILRTIAEPRISIFAEKWQEGIFQEERKVSLFKCTCFRNRLSFTKNKFSLVYHVVYLVKELFSLTIYTFQLSV